MTDETTYLNVGDVATRLGVMPGDVIRAATATGHAVANVTRGQGATITNHAADDVRRTLRPVESHAFEASPNLLHGTHVCSVCGQPSGAAEHFQPTGLLNAPTGPMTVVAGPEDVHPVTGRPLPPGAWAEHLLAVARHRAEPPAGALPAHQLADTTHRDRALAWELLADRDRHRDQVASVRHQLATILGDLEDDAPAGAATDDVDVLIERLAGELFAARTSAASWESTAEAARAEVLRLRADHGHFADVRRVLNVTVHDDEIAPLVAGLAAGINTQRLAVERLRDVLQQLAAAAADERVDVRATVRRAVTEALAAG